MFVSVDVAWHRASARTISRKSRKSGVRVTKKKKRRSHGISRFTVGVYVCIRDRWARTSGPDNIFPRRKNTNSTKRSNSFLLFSFRFHSITSLNHVKFSSTVSIRRRLLYGPCRSCPPLCSRRYRNTKHRFLPTVHTIHMPGLQHWPTAMCTYMYSISF